MREKDIKEGLADLAQRAESDHEVQMARADLYKIAKYAIKLHDMLKGVSEEEGLMGWQQSKITKASDYISSVYHNLDYKMKFGEEVTEGVDSCAHCGCEVGNPKPGCDCKEDCHSPVKEGKSPHKKGSKAYKKQMAAKHASMGESLQDKLAAKLAERSLSKDESKKKKST